MNFVTLVHIFQFCAVFHRGRRRFQVMNEGCSSWNGLATSEAEGTKPVTRAGHTLPRPTGLDGKEPQKEKSWHAGDKY